MKLIINNAECRNKDSSYFFAPLRRCAFASYLKKMLIIALIVLSVTIMIAPTAIAAGNVYGSADYGSAPYDDSSDMMVRLAVVVLAPILIALIVCTIWKRQMKTARLARTADNYIPTNGFNLTGKTDQFLYRTTTRRKIESKK